MAFQGDSIYWVEVEKVVPNPFQPRREFDQNKLQELADSIRMYGVLQPLTVTRKEVQREDGTFYTEYELIAGERRLRASKLSGAAQVPVIIREGEQSEQEKLELAIIENLQREDLNAVDRALAFKQLAESFGLSHASVAEKVGRSREYVSNSIRLLGLPEKILEALKFGRMSEGHARTLLMLNDRPEEQDVIFREILLKKMSVREVERIVRKIATDKVRKKSINDLDSNLIEYEKQFTETLGTRVQILKTDFGGKLTIDYFSVEDLEGMLELMKKEVAESLPGQSELSKLTQHTPLEQVPAAAPESVEVMQAANAVPDSPAVKPEVSAAVDDQSPLTATAQTVPAAAPEDRPEPSPSPEVAAAADNSQLNVEQPESTHDVSVDEQQSAIEDRSPVAQPVSPEYAAPAELATSKVAEPEAIPPEDKAPAQRVHHQPFAARYAPQFFASRRPVVPAPETPTEPVVQAEPVVAPENTTPNSAPETAPEPAQQAVPEKPAEDDSDLYSITNFNV